MEFGSFVLRNAENSIFLKELNIKYIEVDLTHLRPNSKALLKKPQSFHAAAQNLTD